MKRREAREKIVQCLYQLDITNNEPEIAIQSVLEDEDGREATFVREIVFESWKKRDDLDYVIRNYLTGWDLDRIANVDRAILRLATYEMMFRDDIPPHVTVNEAVDLTKMFSTDESSKFVNGVLGKMVKEINHIQKTEQ